MTKDYEERMGEVAAKKARGPKTGTAILEQHRGLKKRNGRASGGAVDQLERVGVLTTGKKSPTTRARKPGRSVEEDSTY